MKVQSGCFRCDGCGTESQSRRLKRGWRLRRGKHFCSVCWRREPTERQYVLRYGVVRGSEQIPQAFWDQQRAARLLWNRLVTISDAALDQAAALRECYAPAPAAVAHQARRESVEAWAALSEAVGVSREQQDILRAAAKQTSAVATAAHHAAKRAAKTAGCDERPVWDQRDAEIAATPALWYRSINGNTQIVDAASPDAWQLARSLADQTIEEYRLARHAWITQPGRRMPHAHGLGFGDQVRAVVRYTNGQTFGHFLVGTPSMTIRPLHADRRAGAIVLLRMAVGCGAIAEMRLHLHRPVPDGEGAIRRVSLIGTRFAREWTWSVHFTCRESLRLLPQNRSLSEATAVDLRWRIPADDPERRYLLVAESLDTTGGRSQVLIDRQQRDRRHAKPGQFVGVSGGGGMISSHEDYAVWQAVSDWCLNGLKTVIGERCGTDPGLRPMRSQGLRIAIRDGRYPACAQELRTWERWHTHAERQLARLRRQLIARRDQIYYEAAHAICRRTRVVIIEAEPDGTRALDLHSLAQNSWAGGQRQLLAPGRFRQILLQVAARYPVTVALIPALYTSRLCPACRIARDRPSAAEHLVCPHDQHAYRQMEGALLELLRRWREQRSGGETKGTARNVHGRERKRDSVSQFQGARLEDAHIPPALAREQNSAGEPQTLRLGVAVDAHRRN